MNTLRDLPQSPAASQESSPEVSAARAFLETLRQDTNARLRDQFGAIIEEPHPDTLLQARDHAVVLLRAGDVKNFNFLRSRLPTWIPNFSGLNLCNAKLQGINLTKAILKNAVLSGADLSGNLNFYASLAGADLRCADMHDGMFRYVDFSGANLDWAVLAGTDVQQSLFIRASARGADFRGIKNLLPMSLADILSTSNGLIMDNINLLEEGLQWLRASVRISE